MRVAFFCRRVFRFVLVVLAVTVLGLRLSLHSVEPAARAGE